MRLISAAVPFLLIISAFNEPITNEQSTDYAFSNAGIFQLNVNSTYYLHTTMYYIFALGELWMATSYCHLSIPLNLDNLKRKIEYLENVVATLMSAQKQSGSVIEKTVVLKAQEDLFFVKSAYDDLVNFLKPPNPQEIQKRFLGALMGGLISGNSTSLIRKKIVTVFVNFTLLFRNFIRTF